VLIWHNCQQHPYIMRWLAGQAVEGSVSVL